ncbi:30S ribosomal protein S15 [Candidatus Micrarchaeota archaeon]|nr:30S ribosomal protein S15 [Candidatus Micrarchaeota archaeon]
MARLHSKKKGKAGTKRPKSKVAPNWSDEKKAELTPLIVKMSKEGVPQSKIGLYLRDQKGVPNIRATLGMTLGAFLKKENAAPEYPEDLLSLIRKAEIIKTHLKTSKKDLHNKVKLSHVESKIHRLSKYYSSKGILPKGWNYANQVSLIAK